MIKHRHALAKEKPTLYEEAFNSLQMQWQCNKHNTYCYIDKTSSRKNLHLKFTPMEWSIWATAVVKSMAVIDYPPRTVEFELILDKHRAEFRQRRRKPKREESSYSDDNLPISTEVISMSQYPYGEFAPSKQPYPNLRVRRYSDDSHLRRDPSARKDITESLKDVGYDPGDWVSQGLDDYFKWLDIQFQSSNFQNALTAVRRQDIGVHSFGMDRVDAEFLITRCGILSGDALRILNNFGCWLNEKLLEVRKE